MTNNEELTLVELEKIVGGSGYWWEQGATSSGKRFSNHADPTTPTKGVHIRATGLAYEMSGVSHFCWDYDIYT